MSTWGTFEPMPFSDATMAAASTAGAAQIVELPCGDFVEGFNATEAPPVPQEVTAFQAKAALLNAGLLTQVQTFMASGSAPAFAQLAWAEAPTFGRQSPTMLAMAQAMGMSSDELDNLFRAAALIVA